MAYKITKYAGKHKIKDTKTGKSVEIDIDKYMDGGTPEDMYMCGGEKKGIYMNGGTPEDMYMYGGKKKDMYMYGGTPEDMYMNGGMPEDMYMNGGMPEDMYMYMDGGGLPKYALGTTGDECGDGPGQTPCPPNPLGEKETAIQRSERLQKEANEKENPYFVEDETYGYEGDLDMSMIDKNDNSVDPMKRFQYDTRGKTYKEMMEEEREKEKEKEKKDFNIYNPYSQIDIPSAANLFGKSLENKDIVGASIGGVKVVTGVLRNLAAGVGEQRVDNRIMQDAMEKQKDSTNTMQIKRDGGKLEDGMLATGDYMRGNNLREGQYNAEIEKGEYFKTNQGDVAEVLGDKHSQGGEKIQMQPEDRVLSDNLKLGAKTAKMIRDDYGITVKAKHTYSDVLDKLTKKIGLTEISKEEAKVYEKINKQTDTKDKMTRDMNLEVLSQKAEELREEKEPLTMQKQEMFDRLYAMQEESKPKSKGQPEEFKEGGELREYVLGGRQTLINRLIDEVGMTEDEAVATVDSVPRKDAKSSYDKGDANKDFLPQLETEKYFGKVNDKNFEEFKQKNDHWYDFSDFDPKNKGQVEMLQEEYNKRTPGNKVVVDGKFGEQTVSLYLSPEDAIAFDKKEVVGPIKPEDKVKTPDNTINKPDEDKYRNTGFFTGYYGSPLPPSALQGTIKSERRFEREKALEGNIDPYIQDIYDQQNTAMRQAESLPPNARAAYLASMRGSTQSQTSKVRGDMEGRDIANAQAVNSRNAGTQRMEENAREADRLAYEQRIYRAQALTDNDQRNYYNNMQDINKQKYMDIYNLNLANSSREDYYFDGQRFRRKTSKSDVLKNIDTSLT